VVLVFVDLLCSEFSQAISQNLRYSNFIFIYLIYLRLNNLYYFCVYDFRSSSLPYFLKFEGYIQF